MHTNLNNVCSCENAEKTGQAHSTVQNQAYYPTDFNQGQLQ